MEGTKIKIPAAEGTHEIIPLIEVIFFLLATSSVHPLADRIKSVPVDLPVATPPTGKPPERTTP